MISKITRLRQAAKGWKNRAMTRLSPRAAHYSSSSSSDWDDDSPMGSRSKRRTTPSGCLAVYVGLERRRFVIPTRFLNLPVFLALLQQAEEEFGFQSSGGLVLPCEPGFFEEVVRLLEEDEERFRGLGLDEFLNVFLCRESSTTSSCHGFASDAPLLHKARV